MTTIIYKTGRTRTHNEGTWPAIGDALDNALVSHFLEVVPPAFLSAHLIQIGSPADHKGPDESPRFDTAQRDAGGVWYYTGSHVSGHFCRISDKIAIDSVTILWAEGPTELVDDLEGRVFDDLISANRALYSLHSCAPDLGYLKVKFTITWTDGESFTGRYEIEKNSDLPNLGRHTARAAAYYAATLEPNRRAAREVDQNAASAQTWTELIERYDLGGAA